jgi:molecular chaperone GrpE
MTDEQTGIADTAETLEAVPTADAMITQLEAEKAALHDQLLRTLADLDNTRKRAERQAGDARVYAIEKFAADLVAVSDSLSRALAALSDDDRAALSEPARNLFDGIAMTEKQMHVVLNRHGMSPIDPVPGGVFDPALHQAVAQIPSAHPAGTIAELFQPGWKIGERTLRAAMVAVSAGTAN